MFYTEVQIPIVVAYAEQLPEKARRLYLAQEYLRLGFGSQTYLSTIFGCSRWTITKGVLELKKEAPIDYTRQRKAGGGRKKRVVQP